MQTNIATCHDMETTPMPREQALLFTNLPYSVAEVEQLRKGFCSKTAEDGWFIYFQKNNMYFHDYSSGHCIFILEFSEDIGEGYHAYYAKANRNREQYPFVSDRLDIELLSLIIDYLLGRSGYLPKLSQ